MGQPGPDLINYWRDFRDELADRFFDKCGYCEMRCSETDSPTKAPTLDHFRPRSKFPELTYEWSNWVFSCNRCNEVKGNLWPESEYVDPCAISVDERPEAYFEVDVATGEIIAKPSLSAADKRKAQNTIDDVGLNARDLLTLRKNRILQLRDALAALPSSARQAFANLASGPEREFAGITGMVLGRLRQVVEL